MWVVVVMQGRVPYVYGPQHSKRDAETWARANVEGFEWSAVRITEVE